MSLEAERSLRDEYPLLAQLLRSYFHEDWYQEYVTPEAALQDFKRGVSQRGLDQTVKQLRDLLDRNLSESQLERALTHDFSSSFVPSLGGQSNVEWMRQTLRVLESGD